MDTSLNKKQLQEILRQMGIEYSPTASKEELIKSLQHENQNQWMKLADGCSASSGKRILRKKSEGITSASEKPQPVQRIESRPDRIVSATRKPEKRPPHREPIRTTESAEPTPELPGTESPPIFQSEKELEDYALKRADGICELCETAVEAVKDRLTVCCFMDPPEGKHRTVKEVAALCPGCVDRVASQRLLKDMKVLKRKARRKGIRQVQISVHKRS